VDQFARAQDLAGQRGVVDWLWERADEALFELRVAFERCQLKHLAAQQEHRRELRAEKPKHVAHDGIKYELSIVCRATKGRENLSGSDLLFQRLNKLALRFGEFSGPLVELFLEIGRRGRATARSGRTLAAREPRRLTAGRLHCCTNRAAADCCVRAANGHAAAPPSSVMNRRRLLIRSPRRRGRAASVEL
jgi:hypothetical protein